MNGEHEGEEGRGRLEDVERVLQSVLERLDRALPLWERVQEGQQTVFDRLAQLEARLEALDASFVRHQGQNEDDFRHAHDDTERVRQELDHHLGDHFRSGANHG